MRTDLAQIKRYGDVSPEECVCFSLEVNSRREHRSCGISRKTALCVWCLQLGLGRAVPGAGLPWLLHSQDGATLSGQRVRGRGCECVRRAGLGREGACVRDPELAGKKKLACSQQRVRLLAELCQEGGAGWAGLGEQFLLLFTDSCSRRLGVSVSEQGLRWWLWPMVLWK